MGEFVVTAPSGEEFTIEAADEQSAMKVFSDYQSKNYTGPADKNGVPEGMVFDPATNRMVDAKALAQQTVGDQGSLAGAWVKGMPFAGEYVDELAGYFTSSDDTKNHPNESQPIQTEVARQSQKLAEETRPKTVLAGKIATGLSAAPAAISLLPGLAPASLGGQMIAGGLTGLGLGTAEGFVSGYGEGEGDNRLDSAKRRALISGATGAVMGGVAPVLAKGASSAAQWLKDKWTVNKQIAGLGLERPAADTIAATLKADDALGAEGAKRLAAAGDDAMLADAGETAAGLLDTTIQRSGEAGRIASKAVQERAAKASGRLKGTMDLVLGRPEGINKATRDINSATAKARFDAYWDAYGKPIDYASKAGREIEDVFSRTPSGILNAAIKKANDKMQVEGIRNMQIMANIADDGTVTFRRMPNMLQVDYLKRMLNNIAEESKSVRGVMTGEGGDAAALAKQLRNAAVKAVPEYAKALKLGGDTIEERNALELGYSMLSKSVTRENVKEAVEGITEAERKQLALGLRQYIDDEMANVTKALTDRNVDARQAAAVLKEMSSDAAKSKLAMALGPEKAKILFKQLEQAEAAIGLKANVMTNSRTFARQEAAKMVEERGKDSVRRAVAKGEPLQATKRSWQAITGANSDADIAKQSKVYSDIADFLTGPRGADAVVALEKLLEAYKTGQLNKAAADKFGRMFSGVTSDVVYQATPQVLPNSTQK